MKIVLGCVDLHVIVGGGYVVTAVGTKVVLTMTHAVEGDFFKQDV